MFDKSRYTLLNIVGVRGSESTIKILTHEDTALLEFDIRTSEKDFPITSFQMIMSVQEYMKVKNIKRVQQFIGIEEYDTFTSKIGTTFEEIERDEEDVLVECDTEDFLMNMSKCVGIDV